VVFTSGHCHHLSVECLALAPTGKSYPPLRQEMQDAFRPEHMRQEAECARVDFPCSSPEQDLRKGKMMTMTLYPPQRGFLYCSTDWQVSATFTFCLAMTLELSNFQKWGIARKRLITCLFYCFSYNKKQMKIIIAFLFFVFSFASAYAVIVEYNWASTAPEYRILIATNLRFIFPVVDDRVDTTNYILDLEEGQYYMKIAPILKGIEGKYSEVIPFTVEKKKKKIEERKNILMWDCSIKTNSPLNLDSALYIALDEPTNFQKVDGLRIKVDTEKLKEGTHYLYYRLRNPLGLESKIRSVKFIVDHTPPEIKVTPTKYRYKGEKVFVYPESEIVYEYQDKTPLKRNYFGINGRQVKGDRFTVSRSTNLLKVICLAVDSGNNESQLVQSYHVDITPPDIRAYINDKEITESKIYYGQSIITLKLMDDSAVADYYTVLDGVTNYNLPLEIKYLKKGVHFLKAGARDIFDNFAEKKWRIEVSETLFVTRWFVSPYLE